MVSTATLQLEVLGLIPELTRKLSVYSLHVLSVSVWGFITVSVTLGEKKIVSLTVTIQTPAV